jgi:hypothetical protein
MFSFIKIESINVSIDLGEIVFEIGILILDFSTDIKIYYIFFLNYYTFSSLIALFLIFKSTSFNIGISSF